MSGKSKRGEVFVDFEFNHIIDEKVNVVCAATLDEVTGTTRKFWLHKNEKAKANFRRHLSQYKRITAYAATAEARSVYALEMDVYGFEWHDLFTEYRMITNHNDELQWGKQLVRGKVKTVRKPKPKFMRTEEDFGTGFVATHSLAEAAFKLLGVKLDTEHKNEMRDLIISAPKKFTAAQRKSILNYCASDVKHLPAIRKEIIKHNLKKNPAVSYKRYIKGALERGDFLACTAIMECKGYPINYEATKNFSSQVNSIFYDLQREINKLFPEISPFKWNKREQRYTWQQKVTREWIEQTHDTERWKKTDKGQLSLALEAFTQFYDFKHDYPKDNFGAQMVRFLKLKQNLYGFKVGTKESDRKTFWDYVGPDQVVRPYLNAFRAQSSRSQPSAGGFIPLKPAWMRALIQPPEGYYICGIDYSSQEFFLSALLSGDETMINAYLSGDPYLFFGKMAGAIPKHGTKEEYSTERDLFKSTTLGLSYLMTCVGLAVKLTQDTKKVWTEEQAQEMIDLFYELYERLKEYQEEVKEFYEEGNPLTLADGWTMFTDNDNIRSSLNMPTQGTGAVIMRRAVVLAMKKYGLYIPFPLHDALYVMGKVENMKREIKILRHCMREAFMSVFEGETRKLASKIRLDAAAWGPSLKTGEFSVKTSGGPFKVKTSKLYIDKRAIKDYEMFSKYFEIGAEYKL